MLPNKVHPCHNCPFRKDCTIGWLGSKRMSEIIEHDSFVCHKDNKLQCAGHMVIKGEKNAFVSLAKTLNIPLLLSGQELIFDTKEECIEHHII